MRFDENEAKVKFTIKQDTSLTNLGRSKQGSRTVNY